jgi:hypothetical protein
MAEKGDEVLVDWNRILECHWTLMHHVMPPPLASPNCKGCSTPRYTAQHSN